MKKSLVIIILLLAALLLCACAAPAPAADTSKPFVTVSFTYADGLKYPPSYAIWIIGSDSDAVTLYATRYAARISDSTRSTERRSVLPVWNGMRGDADIVSGATPQKQAELTLNIPDAFLHQTLTLYIEANASYDYNDHYAEGLTENDEGYSDVNGQPSVVYAVQIDPNAPDNWNIPTLLGTGNVLGADSDIHDADNLSTAAGLLTDLMVTWNDGK